MDGPFTCLCDEAGGWLYDEEADDGSCFYCASIGLEDPFADDDSKCASCHYEFGWVCDVCISDDYMPTPNGDGCIPKLPNCDVTPYEQP